VHILAELDKMDLQVIGQLPFWIPYIGGNYSGYWHVDSNNSGMTDYHAVGQYFYRSAEYGYLKDQRLLTETYWKDGNDNLVIYDLNRLNYIILIDSQLLSKYFIVGLAPENTSLPTASQLFEEDGSLKSTIPNYDKLSESEREVISYILVSIANAWQGESSEMNFKNFWIKPDCPQSFSSFIFIPTNAVDLTDMASYTSIKIAITWDLDDVLYEEYVPTTDYSTVKGADYPFMTDENPWESNNWYEMRGPDTGTGNGIIKWYYWTKRFSSSDAITYTAYMPGSVPVGSVYKKIPFLYEFNPIVGPMNWSVSVSFE
jgi:hypothetical protein